MMESRERIRVLLVEDNPADARLIEELLRESEESRFEIRRARTLTEGIAQREGCHVVLLDLSLPDAHGLETVQRMLAASSELPVVILTGHADEMMASQAVSAGAQDYLVKNDITAGLVSRSVRYAIERKKAEENGRRLIAAQVEKAKSQQAERTARFLADVGGVVLASLDREMTASALARMLVPTLADSCAIDLFGADKHWVPVARVGADAAVGATAEPIFGRVRSYMETLLAADERTFEDGQGRVLTIDEQYAALARDLPAHAALLAPMVVRKRVLGVLTLVAINPGRHLGAEELALAEDVARRAALAFENARLYSEARTAVRARDEVLAVVSHDLRNPLNVFGISIQTFRRIIAPEHLPPRGGDMLMAAERAYRRMARLLDDLLDVSRIDEGKLTLNRQPCDVLGLLSEAVDLQRPLAFEKDIAIGVVPATPVPERLAEIDRERFAQLMGNLLGNALKFTPRGGRIDVALTEVKGYAVVSVSDSGPGIASENLPHLFDRFWQDGSKRREGVGLGLAIAKGIVEAHGGSIEAASEPGAGATFRFRLPLSDASAAELRATDSDSRARAIS